MPLSHSCTRCGARISYDSAIPLGQAIDHLSLRPVREIFRIRQNGALYSRCRECERNAMRALRQAGREELAQAAASAVRAVATGIARRFGVELELTMPNNVTREHVMQALANAGLSDWRTKYDGSLSGNGIEVVSPPLSGDDGERQVREACRVLERLGLKPNRSCGLHVHHEINDLDMGAVRRLSHNWNNAQDVIDGLVSESRRGGRNQYCRRIDYLNALDRISDMRQLRSLRASRYQTLNLTAYGRYGTVEFRQHQGTCSGEKVVSWIRFGQALIDTAKVTETLFRPTTVKALLDAQGARLDATAKTFLLGRAVEFNAVPVA